METTDHHKWLIRFEHHFVRSGNLVLFIVIVIVIFIYCNIFHVVRYSFHSVRPPLFYIFRHCTDPNLFYSIIVAR